MTHPDSDEPVRTGDDRTSTDRPDTELPEAVARLTESDLDSGERKRLLGRVAASASGGARRGLRRFAMGPRAATRWTLDTLVDIAPHLPVRDLDTLRRHHDGKSGEALAETLVRNA